MTQLHSVKMTHKTADTVLDALRESEARGNDEAGTVADILTESFNRDHRAEDEDVVTYPAEDLR